jgi:AcrR family transcriptional regulator
VSARRKPPSESADARLVIVPRPDESIAAETDPTESEPGWRARVVGRSLAPAADKAVRRGQQLISAASHLILRSGGDDFTVQKVASEAGLTLRAFYQHFSGKDDLLIALIEESQLVMARLLGRHAARFDEPLDRLGSALYWALDERQHTAGDYNAALLRYVERASLTSPERVSAARRPVVAVFTRLIDDAMVSGAIERGDPERSAFALMALHISYTRVNYLGNDLSSRLPSISELVRFCVHGLGARLPVGWEDRFVMTDEDAAISKRESEKLAVESLRRARRP